MKLPGIHNTFILIISSLVIFWLITILFFFDRWNNLVHFASVRTEIAEVRYNFSGFRDALDQSIPKYADFHTERDATAMAMERMRSSLANISLIKLSAKLAKAEKEQFESTLQLSPYDW